jgi:quercetin dioxygenase-like cupin family protein
MLEARACAGGSPGRARVDAAEPGRDRPGSPAFKHWHPGEEIIYVLEGAILYQIENEPPVTVNAGEVFFVPAEAVHTATNAGNAPAKELATYVVEVGKPLITLVDDA